MTSSLDLLTDRRSPLDGMDGANCPGAGGCVGRSELAHSGPDILVAL